VFLDDIRIIAGLTDFQYASGSLRQDRAFVLSLVKETSRVLYHAPVTRKNDKGILAARPWHEVLVRFPTALTVAFELGNDFEFLCDFAMMLRSAIRLHDSCRLSCLNQGAETLDAFHKKIAEFDDLWLDTEVESLRDALANIWKRLAFRK
jgi:hypothetical protein